MAKDFRNASQLPDDFLCVYGVADDSDEFLYEQNTADYKKQAELREKLSLKYDFRLNSNMIGVKETVEKSGWDTVSPETDLGDITVESPNPDQLQFKKNEFLVTEMLVFISINDKYMDYGSASPYPMLPGELPGETLNDHLPEKCYMPGIYPQNWEYFERVEKALEANKAKEDFITEVDGLSNSTKTGQSELN